MMPQTEKLQHGTRAWFEMVGRLMCEAAAHAGLPPQLNLSLVERYSDGAALGDGLVQGLRFDIVSGVPSFRAGASRTEQGDITIEITAAAALTLNQLYSADPAYAAALHHVLATGQMRLRGDPSQLGDWLKTVHDPIVDRTTGAGQP